MGNTLAGDDGAGVVLLEELRRRLGSRPGLDYAELAGDLYAIWDLLARTRAILFLDAVCGSPPGRLVIGKTAPRAFSASFHQSDVSTVMRSLATLREKGLPAWTIWGITIDPPQNLGEGLSSPVLRAVEESAERLFQQISQGTLEIAGYRIPALTEV